MNTLTIILIVVLLIDAAVNIYRIWIYNGLNKRANQMHKQIDDMREKQSKSIEHIKSIFDEKYNKQN